MARWGGGGGVNGRCTLSKNVDYGALHFHTGRGSRGIAAPRGMSAHPIIGGSTQYLVLRPCHTVDSILTHTSVF